MEETKWLKPSGKRVTKYGDSASVQAVTRVNAEQASKRTMRRPTRLPYRGRLTRLGELSEVVRPIAVPGYWRQHVHKESARNTGNPKAWSAMTNRTPARDRPGALGRRRGSQYRGSRVMPGEGRDLSSRRTQHVVRDLEIGQPINSEEGSETAEGVARESEGRSRLPLLRPVRQDQPR